MHLEHDFARDRVGDAEPAAEVLEHLAAASSVSIIFGRAATIASMLSHSPIRQ